MSSRCRQNIHLLGGIPIRAIFIHFSPEMIIHIISYHFVLIVLLILYKFQMGMTRLLNKRHEIVHHLPCIVLGDTEVFIHDKYREQVMRYSIYRRLARY
jgi:hypothetical protein